MSITIANEILAQMGGTSKLAAMTGAKNFIAIENGVRFRIGRNSAGINTVTVKLNDMDLYDIEYGRVRTVKHLPTYKVLAKSESIYNDMLKADFEANTGMYLTF